MVFTPREIECGIVIWCSESRDSKVDSKVGMSGNKHGTDVVAIGIAALSNLARAGASISVSGGFEDGNEGRLGVGLVPVLTRDGLDVFILLQ